MSRFPALRGKTQVRFSNPLAGKVYDNNKYQTSCFFAEDQPHMQQLQAPQKSQSLVYYSKREMAKANFFGLPAEMKSESMIKTSKVTHFSSEMLIPYNKRCHKHNQSRLSSSNPEDLSIVQLAPEKTPLFKIKPTKFQQIEVTFLQLFPEDSGLITQQNDHKKFRVNLSRYFYSFFKDKAAGVVFEQLSDFVQNYMDEAIAKEETQIRQNNDQRFNIPHKRALYQRLLELQKCDNNQEIKDLLKHYCIPRRETRRIFLRDLLSLITNMLHQEFSLPKHLRYCLLDQKGQKINDFAEIKFSTKQLFVAQQSQVESIFHQYFNQMQRDQTTQYKHSFRQTLKNHFRQQVAHGLYDESQILKPFTEQRVQKKNNLTRAQRIINLKNAKNKDGRKKFKEMLEIQKHSPSKQASLELKKQPKPIKQQQRYISTEEKMIEEFKKLKRVNDYENAQFKNDESNRDKVQFAIILKQSPYFKFKNQQQIQRIYSSLTFSQPNPSSSYSTQLITLEQYISMRKIIGCLAEREKIVNFVDRYLRYDEYGQLQKQGLKQTLSFVIGQQKKTSEVILLTIWSWLQKNGVISNDVLSRGNMQLMYQRNKIVYYLLISLIFGTNETTLLELAEDVIII